MTAGSGFWQKGWFQMEQWRRLQAAARLSLKELLLAPEARTEGLVPARGQARRRGAPEL